MPMEIENTVPGEYDVTVFITPGQHNNNILLSLLEGFFS